MTAIYLPAAATCGACGFTTTDVHLLAGHSCDVQSFGGRCEDYPCCGHEQGDCNGLLYGSDEAIKAEAYAHAYCDHEAGIYQCDDEGDDDADPETCEHEDTSYTPVWRGDDLWLTNRECSRCYTDLPETQETDPDIMDLYRYN